MQTHSSLFLVNITQSLGAKLFGRSRLNLPTRSCIVMWRHKSKLPIISIVNTKPKDERAKSVKTARFCLVIDKYIMHNGIIEPQFVVILASENIFIQLQKAFSIYMCFEYLEIASTQNISL